MVAFNVHMTDGQDTNADILVGKGGNSNLTVTMGPDRSLVIYYLIDGLSIIVAPSFP